MLLVTQVAAETVLGPDVTLGNSELLFNEHLFSPILRRDGEMSYFAG